MTATTSATGGAGPAAGLGWPDPPAIPAPGLGWPPATTTTGAPATTDPEGDA